MIIEYFLNTIVIEFLLEWLIYFKTKINEYKIITFINPIFNKKYFYNITISYELNWFNSAYFWA